MYVRTYSAILLHKHENHTFLTSSRLIAGAENAIEINFSYYNRGPEEASEVFLLISDIPTQFFSSVSIAANVSHTNVHRGNHALCIINPGYYNFGLFKVQMP